MCYHGKLCKEAQKTSKPVGEDAVRDETSERPFIGVKITSALQRQLDQCSSVHKRYFERRESQSLQIVIIKGKQILGRPVKRGATIDSVEDAVQNIKSILLKICPQYDIRASEIKVYSADSTHLGSGG